MSEIKNEATTAQPTVAVKKVRRGVSNQTQATAQLKFHEKDAAQNGLFVGHLEEVRVDWSTNADGKQFSGLNVPRLTYHFASNHANLSERRHVYHTLFPAESNVNTIPNGSEAWKVDNVLNFIKHVLDVFYLKGRQFTEAEEEFLSLQFCDFDEDGNYVAVDPQDVLNAYGVLFNNVVSLMNGHNVNGGEDTNKPCYKDANGKDIAIWMKLLRHKRRKDAWVNVGNNGDLGFDQFIGSGLIEILKPNTPAAILRIDLAKESITPKETKREPTIGVPGLGMGAVMAGPGEGMSMGGNNSAFINAGAEEMPF
jgi:hypothetical protein